MGCNFTPCCGFCSKWRAISLWKILCLHVMKNEAGYVPSNGEISILETVLWFPLSVSIKCLTITQSLYCCPHKITNIFAQKRLSCDNGHPLPCYISVVYDSKFLVTPKTRLRGDGGSPTGIETVGSLILTFVGKSSRDVATDNCRLYFGDLSR